MFEKAKTILELAKADARRFMRDNLARVDDVTGVGMALFILVVIGAVSVYVANEIYGIASVTSGSDFYTASQKVVSVMNTGWSMMLIVVIAILAGIIILAIRGIRQ